MIEKSLWDLVEAQREKIDGLTYLLEMDGTENQHLHMYTEDLQESLEERDREIRSSRERETQFKDMAHDLIYATDAEIESSKEDLSVSERRFAGGLSFTIEGESFYLEITPEEIVENYFRLNRINRIINAAEGLIEDENEDENEDEDE